MAKKVAVVAVNPVNGYGLFQYLESFYENKIAYKVFAVANTKSIRTNSGIALEADDVIANLKGHSDEFDALVFACGDAMPVFASHAGETYNIDLIHVVKEFGESGKLMIGHCASSLVFEIAGITKGKKLAIHPFIKSAIKQGIATDSAYETDGNFYTAQGEHCIAQMMPSLLKALQ
jgi:putative intracellular protease/amidase